MSEISKNLLRQKLNHADDNTHKRVSLYVALFFFAFIIVADIFLIASHSRQTSENENRVLAQAPVISGQKLVSGKFMTQFEDFVSDQFFARDGWIQAKLKIDKTLGKAESNGVYLGKNGYLFEDPGLMNKEAVEKSIEQINAFAAAQPSVRFVMTLVPNAAAIYPQYVPEGAPIGDQLAEIEQIRTQLDPSITFTDLSNDLKVHSNEQLYYKSDHHWTSLGAKYAFEKMAPDLQLGDISKEYTVMTVADDFSGTMASSSGSFTTTDTVEIYIPENLPEYYVEYDGDPAKYPTLFNSAALETKNKYEVFMGGNHPKATITVLNETGRNLLLLKDSYANCFLPFLLPYYDHIVVVDPRYYSDDLAGELQRSKITDVLILYNENTFRQDNSLSGVLKDAVEANEAEDLSAPDETAVSEELTEPEAETYLEEVVPEEEAAPEEEFVPQEEYIPEEEFAPEVEG